MTKVSLVRHGRVHNPDQVYYGRLGGFALAEEGRAQAATAGRFLAREPVTAIYHSPMLRARQTAEIVRAQLPLPVPLVECALLNEIHSPYDGQTASEMERRNWDFYSELSPPYEFPPDILARMLAFFDYARERHPGQHVVGVSHGDPITFAILWALDRPASAEQRQLLREGGLPVSYPTHASIATFTLTDEAGKKVLDFSYHTPADAR